jgi:hypothetical protein
MAPSRGGVNGKWWCAHHYNCLPQDMQSITRLIHMNKDLRDVIADGRRMHLQLGSESRWPSDWARMRSMLAFAGYDDPDPAAKTFSVWLYACETLLRQRIREGLAGKGPTT